MKKNLSLKKFFLLFTFGLFFFDQSLKHKIRSAGGFYVCNQGFSFGLSLPAALFWLISASITIYLGMLFLASLKEKNVKNIKLLYLSLFLAGALSNLFDRLAMGCTLDYLKLPFVLFPYFNFADFYIFTVCALLIIHNLIHRNPA